MLKARQDLSDGEKHRVAEYLSGKEGVAVLRTYKAFPEFSIALGLAGSGTRDLDDATKGLESYEKRWLERFLKEQRQEQGRGLEKGPRQDKGRDFGLSL